jgi:L-ascorbate metabolism protein UlaG (beta-lactamase superfamily)
MAGDIALDFTWPARLSDFRHGLVLNWLIEIEGIRIFHIDSADFLEEKIKDVRADVLCLCAIGRKWRPNYVSDIVRIIQPKLIIACHWDCFWTPFHGKQYLLPGVDLSGFVSEIETAGVEPAVLPIGGKIQL